MVNSPHSAFRIPHSAFDTDFLIVGQGLAGSLLAHFLLLENQRIKVIDFPHSGASSKVAAGVINPVTGRRIAKSWRFEALFPFAKQTYRELETLLNIEIWRERNILRALPTVFDENEWLRRSAYPEYQPYIAEPPDLGSYEGKIQPVRAWGELTQTAQVAMPELVAAFRNFLSEKDIFLEEDFDYQQVKPMPGCVNYKGISARKIIFCEGARAIHNPFFNHLPFIPTKGELLLVRIPGTRFDKILKHNIFIVPLESLNIPGLPTADCQLPTANCYWVGSTSRFEFDDDQPSEAQRQILLSQLEEVLKTPFEVVQHLAGIRPTVFDKRPFLGLHPVHDSLAIFNGLGTKGASLAPFFAKQMSDFLMQKGTLEEEVDIGRFQNKSG